MSEANKLPAEAPFNIASLLTEAAAKWPDLPAVVAPHRPDALGRGSLTMSELDASSGKLAAWLMRNEAVPGSRVIVMVRPGLDFVSIVFALFKAALVPVMVDPGMGLKRMMRCLAEGRPSGIVGIPAAHILSLTAPGSFKGIKLRVTVGRRFGWSGGLLVDIMAAPDDGAAEVSPVQTAPEDMAAILFTSGSTGAAKGVVYTHAMFRAQIEAIRTGFDIQPGGVDLATFPLFGLFAPALGLTSIIPDMNPANPAKADPRRIIEPIINHRVTSMFASPTILTKTASFAHEHNLNLPSLKRVIAAGAPVQPRSVAAFTSIMSGEGKLITPYGATEGVPLTRMDGEEINCDTKLMTEQGLGMCVGRPLAEVKLGIIAISDEVIAAFKPGLLLPPGEIGEIISQGPMVSRSYFQRPRETALSVMPEEDNNNRFWRRMGDVGWMDAEGRLWFCGRKSHRVITSQGTLFTIPCEAIFNNHPLVSRSALVGVGKPGRQKPVMVVEPHKYVKGPKWEKLKEELEALARANPRTISINTFLCCRAFPVDVRHNAKINREKLAVWAAKELPPAEAN